MSLSLGFAYKVKDGTVGIVTYYGLDDLDLYLSHVMMHLSQFCSTCPQDQTLHLVVYFKEKGDLCATNVAQNLASFTNVVSSGNRGLFKGPANAWVSKAQL